MNKTLTYFIAFIALMAVMVTALPSHALSPVRVGEKRFERGWFRLTSNSREDAKEHFIKSADAFAEALAEDPRSRTASFESNITKAGLSFYYAGRYEESIKAMGEVYNEKTTIWESSIYTATAYAYLGDEAMTLKWLKIFQDKYSGQPVIANEAAKAIKGLEGGTTDVQQAADALDAALINQFKQNINIQSQGLTYGNDRCNGAHWWRYNRKPCKNVRSRFDY